MLLQLQKSEAYKGTTIKINKLILQNHLKVVIRISKKIRNEIFCGLVDVSRFKYTNNLFFK